MNIEFYKKLLDEKGYLYLGHGTGRNGNNEEIVQSIFSNGLRTKDNSLYYTSIAMTLGENWETLKKYINNWPHLNSNKIILIKLPIEYFNPIGDMQDLGGEKYHAFYKQVLEDNGEIKNYLDPKFIVGCYDSNTQDFLINPNFEAELSNKTKNELNKKLQEAIEITNTRLENSMCMFSSVEPDITSSQSTDTTHNSKPNNDDWER